MIISAKSSRINSNKLVVMIGPWKPMVSPFSKAKKILSSAVGFIEYEYSDDLLNEDPKLSKKNILEFVNEVKEQLRQLNNKKPREFLLYGQSLGGLFCMILADKIKVSKVRLILPGDNLADALWHGWYTRHLRKEYEKQGYTLNKLKNLWKEVSPDNYFKKFAKFAKFSIVISKNDKIIPAPNGRKLKEYIDKHKIREEYKEVGLNHPLVLIKEAYNPKQSLKFLLS